MPRKRPLVNKSTWRFPGKPAPPGTRPPLRQRAPLPLGTRGGWMAEDEDQSLPSEEAELREQQEAIMWRDLERDGRPVGASEEYQNVLLEALDEVLRLAEESLITRGPLNAQQKAIVGQAFLRWIGEIPVRTRMVRERNAEALPGRFWNVVADRARKAVIANRANTSLEVERASLARESVRSFVRQNVKTGTDLAREQRRRQAPTPLRGTRRYEPEEP